MDDDYRISTELLPKLAWRVTVERRQNGAWRQVWQSYAGTLSAAMEDGEEAIRIDKRLAATCKALGIDADAVTVGEVAI